MSEQRNEAQAVDVLEVMDYAFSSMYGRTDDGRWRQMKEARAAVAELVEAARAVAATLANPGAPTRTERAEMIASLRAALARFGGAS